MTSLRHTFGLKRDFEMGDSFGKTAMLFMSVCSNVILNVISPCSVFFGGKSPSSIGLHRLSDMPLVYHGNALVGG